MAGKKKLDQLDVWMNSREHVQRIYRLTSASPCLRDYAFCSHIRSAAISIMANIAEGYGRSSDKDFARFLDIARGSALEVQSLICVGVDAGYVGQEAFDELTDALVHIVAQITSLSQYLRRQHRA